ncbi:maleylpyruvate isomerase family mycothiol-dependent enzyme [Nocardioides rubriscoriae]|uniref:maleylpyruvate isomerase family mycothiol-dependent enzyme n=1 Tax=Nocardioides rubriscoriae TaxID=642762 RepID=UPI0011DFC5CD|nr:maleylpyruvate isomerase family mycothiol-dependent enzyme [Nocardioides rubriscoriae]
MTQQLEGPDAAVEWRGVLDRVRGFVIDAVEHDGVQATNLTVPACPDWSAHDLLCHMVGLVADVLDGHEPDDHHPDWTQAQVVARRGRTSLEVLDEWAGLADRMDTYLRERSTRPLNDAIIHEQDLRGALQRPGARDCAGVASVRETLATRLAGSLDGLAPLELRSDAWSWSSGEGESGVVLEASGFDLFRAVSSRRTAAQLRSYVVAGDVTPYLDHFAQLGDLPTRSLPE